MGLKMLPILVLFMLAAHDSHSATVRRFQSRWDKHRRDFGIVYSNSTEEERRYARFEKNVDFIEEWNSNPKNTFKLGVNQFTHLDPDYIKSKILLPTRYNPPTVGGRNRVTTRTTTPRPVVLNSYVNWTSKFVGIKNQGDCGSCYAFAAAGVVEAAYAIKKNKTVSLSEEQILECTYGAGIGNLGCGGGFSDTTLKWIKNSHPLYSTADYPYTSSRVSTNRPGGTCRAVSNPTLTPVSVATTGLAGNTENSVAAYVQNNGPVTAYVYASLNTFMQYKRGVYSDSSCKTSTDHAVIIVGFGTDSTGKDYWIIRNSWGTSWGMNGYMLMARNKGGMCGIVSENYYATVN